MPSSSTQNNPPGFELVRINKAASKGKFRHLDEAVREGRLTIADLLEFEQWLTREDFAYAQRKWKEYFRSGAKVVGFDSEVQTFLSPKDPAGGLDLADIRKELQAGRLKKPSPKISSQDIVAAVFGEEE